MDRSGTGTDRDSSSPRMGQGYRDDNDIIDTVTQPGLPHPSESIDTRNSALPRIVDDEVQEGQEQGKPGQGQAQHHTAEDNEQQHSSDSSTSNDMDTPAQPQETEPPIPLTWLELAVKYRTVLESAAKAAALFLFCLAFLVLLLHELLPPIDPADRPAVKIPKSFEDLKRLNEVLQIYKERNFGRVLGSFVALYLLWGYLYAVALLLSADPISLPPSLQAYSLPGSMYLSILAGAMYGVAFALPLVCTCVATGATLCYLISALLGPALLLASKRWRDRLEVWRERIRNQGGNMISYLIVLRIAPLPPHWVVNVVCPHLDISIPLFWISTFFGVMAVSFIHVQIGTTLEQMGSAKDFHLISWRNFFGLAGVVVGVMCPVAIRYYWQQELAEAAGVGDGVVLPAGDMAAASEPGDIHIVVHEGEVEVYKQGEGNGRDGKGVTASQVPVEGPDQRDSQERSLLQRLNLRQDGAIRL